MTTASRTSRWLLVALAPTVTLATPGEAQTLLRSPQQIAYCLCQNRAVDESKEALDQQRLLDERDAARLAFQGEATPAYSAAVERYNGAIEAYSASCAGALFDQVVLAEVQRNLYCPR